MRKSDTSWYFNPTRQSAFAIFFIIISVIKALVRGLWPLLVLVLFRSGNYDRGLVAMGLTILGCLIVLGALAFFWRFFFYVDGRQLHVEKGIFRRSKVDIPFDRIQSVELQQPLLHRLAGVSKVKIDTAGSSGEEFSFNALSTKKAQSLKDFIQHQRQSKDQRSMRVPADDHEILRLDLLQLMKIGVSQNHIRTAGLIILFGSGLIEQIKDVLGDHVFDRLQGVGDFLAERAWIMAVVILGLLLVIAFIGTLIRTILRYYDFVLYRKRDGYIVASGLLNRYEHVVADRKVQYIRWTSNPIKKYFRMVRLRFFQASSNVLSAAKAITIPGCSYEQLAAITSEHFGKIDVGSIVEMAIQRQLFWRRWLFLGIIPFVVVFGLFVVSSVFMYFFIAVAWLGISYWYQDLYQRTWQASIFPTLLRTSSGVIERTSHLIKQYKVQGVQLATSPYLRRKGLATVVLFTASGKLKIPYLELAEAHRVRDFLLHRVETHRGPWM